MRQSRLTKLFATRVADNRERVARIPRCPSLTLVQITPGQEGIVISITPLSIHGDRYVDVVIADDALPDDPHARLSARLGSEAIDGDLAPGDRVLVEGFLRMVTGIRKIG